MNHIAQLIDAVHILCSSKITFDKFQTAKRSLNSFVDKFEVLYGEYRMVFNVHLLKHLADCVRSIGPLQMYSNYNFEDHIGHLVGLTKGTTDTASQICEKYLMEKNCLMNHSQKSTIFQTFYEQINGKRKFSTCRNLAGHILIGKTKKQTSLTDEDKLLLSKTLKLPKNCIVDKYDAVLLNSKTYYEVTPTMKKRTNDSFLFNLETKRFAEINAIIVVNENVHMLINEKFQVLNEGNMSCKSNIYLKVTEFNRKRILNPQFVGPKFALVKFDDVITCSEFPNTCERN